MNYEDRIRRAFADTGWKVRWNDGWFWDAIGYGKIHTNYKSVVLESPGGKVLVNAGTTSSGMADRYGRDYVFASAEADMSGAVRPYMYVKSWINVAWYLVGRGVRLNGPKWYSDGAGACLTSSVEEFALKLSVFGWGETEL